MKHNFDEEDYPTVYSTQINTTAFFQYNYNISSK